MDEEQTNPVAEERPNWKKLCCTVTPFSKYLAMVLFVALPFVGFWLGMEYGSQPVVLPVDSSDTMRGETGGDEYAYSTTTDDESATTTSPDIAASNPLIYRNDELGFAITADTPTPKVRRYTSTHDTVSLSFVSVEVLYTQDDTIVQFEDRMQQFPHVLFVETQTRGEHTWRYYTNTGGSLPNHQYVIERGADLYKIIIDDTMSKAERDAIVGSVQFYEPQDENVVQNETQESVYYHTGVTGNQVATIDLSELFPEEYAGMRLDVESENINECVEFSCSQYFEFEYWGPGDRRFGGFVIKNGYFDELKQSYFGAGYVAEDVTLSNGLPAEHIDDNGDTWIVFEYMGYNFFIGCRYGAGCQTDIADFADLLMSSISSQ
jgi:hypothetical protein